MVKRRTLTTRQKAEIRFRQGDCCKICGDPLAGKCEFDHVHALTHGGSNHLDNFRALCIPCHRGKTKADVAAAAKVKRVIRKAAERSQGITNAKQRALAQMKRRNETP